MHSHLRPPRRPRTTSSPASRSAFTIIELLVSTGVIGILLAILLPALQNARLSARRTQCLTNIRSLSQGVLMSVDVQNRFPASGNWTADASGNPNADIRAHNWVVTILPWIDRQVLHDKYNFHASVTSPANQAITQTFISFLTCPEDFTVLEKGDLSYVANGGMAFTVHYQSIAQDCPVDRTHTPIDLNGNGITCTDYDLDYEDAAGALQGVTDRQFMYRLGLFFQESWPKGTSRRSHRIATIRDGISQTIMLSENVRAGADPAAPTENWASPNPYRVSFYSGIVCHSARCSDGNVDYHLANSGLGAINGGLERPEGRSPSPNSFHRGGVHFSFCDGHVQFVSQHIDGAVYASLLSPQGTRVAGTLLEQSNPPDGSY